nr:DUF3465 domain-containing protein [uncultured Desulfobulbus sp.]
MKKLVLILFACLTLYGIAQQAPIVFTSAVHAKAETATGDNALAHAYQNQQSDIQVHGSGTVIKILADDTKGRKHQRFILRLHSGQTLLVAHNIDLAPRIISLRTGDSIEFYGEYEWNAQGGVLHWTHRDPGNRHADGWLKHKGKMYH